jgi:hypothetical protein
VCVITRKEEEEGAVEMGKTPSSSRPRITFQTPLSFLVYMYRLCAVIASGEVTHETRNHVTRHAAASRALWFQHPLS